MSVSLRHVRASTPACHLTGRAGCVRRDRDLHNLHLLNSPLSTFRIGRAFRRRGAGVFRLARCLERVVPSLLCSTPLARGEGACRPFPTRCLYSSVDRFSPGKIEPSAMVPLRGGVS